MVVLTPMKIAPFLVACGLFLLFPPDAGLARGGQRAAHSARRSVDYDAPGERWREGPVRYLLSKEEDATFRAIESDEERARFVQRFWASRDPVPATPENEYRTLFFRR